MDIYISIIVCTYNRIDLLHKTLHALVNQIYATYNYEIIVVDNYCVKKAQVQHIVDKINASMFSNLQQKIQYIYYPKTGLSNARNAGLTHSKGKVICFIDDDAIAPPNWLSTIESAFREHPEAGVIGGHILLKTTKPKPRILKPGLEIFWSQFITEFTEYTEVKAWKDFPWGANWSVRRAAIFEIGGFDIRYGRGSFGRKYWCGEELIAAAQIQNLGYKIAIEPRSMVIHKVDRSRITLSHLWNVILSDKLVRYQAQKEGFLLKKITRSPFKLTRKRISDFLQNILEFINRNRHPILFFFQISAHAVIFSMIIFDFFKCATTLLKNNKEVVKKRC
jgi:glycosyltransferase involved in cell wall biosynthesis